MKSLFIASSLLAAALAWSDGQFAMKVEPHSITLQTGERTYTVGDDGKLQPLGMRANIAGMNAESKGIWILPQMLQSTKVLRDDAQVKRVRGVWALSEGTPRYELELELEVRAGLPGLTVQSRLRRLSEATGECYYFWALDTAVTHYTAPGAPAREFPVDEWHVRPQSSWLFISQKRSGEGWGVITDGRVGRAPASGEGTAPGEVGAFPYLICTPRTTTLSQGDSLDVNFTVFSASSAAEVVDVAKRLGAANVDKVLFDAQLRTRTTLIDLRSRRESRRLQTQDGLSVGLTPEGRVASVRAGGQTLSPSNGPGPLTGFFLRDHKARSPFTPVAGSLTGQGGALRQTGSALKANLSATYRAFPNRIEVSGELTDTTGTDRAISVYYALPVRADVPWQWGDSIAASRPVVTGEEYLSTPATPATGIGANGLNSLYPFASLSGPAGLALSIPLDQPRVCRMTYNPGTQQFFLAFDLALTPVTTAFPSRASFSFSLYTCDPRWGFRAAAAKYYAMYPQFFEKRVQRDGGWVCWGNCADVPDLDQLCYAYHWGLIGPDAVSFDNAHNIYALPYIEATNMHQTMEGATSTTSEDVVKRLEWIADPNRTEPIPAWGYDHPYGGQLGDRDTVLRRSAAAYLKSLMYDRQGHIYGSVSSTEFSLPIAKYIPCNANPALPGGIGEFFLDFWLPKNQAMMESKGGRVDGIAMDNFHCGDVALSRRREQFPYETIPLTFETATGEPVIVKNFTTYEWTREAARRLRPQGRFIIANTCSATFPFTYNLLDIHGYEWGIEGLAPFARTIAYHKPVCSLPVQEPHKEEAWVKWHLRYGFMPGGYANYQTMLNRPAMVKYAPLARRLQAAGWEPVTEARSSIPQVTLERFGSHARGTLLFTAYNADTGTHTATVTLETSRLGLPATATVTELVSGQQAPYRAGSFRVEIPAKDVQVFEVR